ARNDRGKGGLIGSAGAIPVTLQQQGVAAHLLEQGLEGNAVTAGDERNGIIVITELQLNACQPQPRHQSEFFVAAVLHGPAQGLGGRLELVRFHFQCRQPQYRERGVGCTGVLFAQLPRLFAHRGQVARAGVDQHVRVACRSSLSLLDLPGLPVTPATDQGDGGDDAAQQVPAVLSPPFLDALDLFLFVRINVHFLSPPDPGCNSLQSCRASCSNRGSISATGTRRCSPSPRRG